MYSFATPRHQNLDYSNKSLYLCCGWSDDSDRYEVWWRTQSDNIQDCLRFSTSSHCQMVKLPIHSPIESLVKNCNLFAPCKRWRGSPNLRPACKTNAHTKHIPPTIFLIFTGACRRFSMISLGNMKSAHRTHCKISLFAH